MAAKAEQFVSLAQVLMLKSEFEIWRELAEVRKLLAQARASDDDVDMLYGAQQALAWMTGSGLSPSELQRMVLRIADELDEMYSADDA